jgi:hypothetical protein
MPGVRTALSKVQLNQPLHWIGPERFPSFERFVEARPVNGVTSVMCTSRIPLLLALVVLVGCEERSPVRQTASSSPATAPSVATSPATRPVNDWRHGTGVCSVHHRQMDTVEVHGLAGFIDFVPGYGEAREKLFPNAGIEYGPELYSPETGLIYVCSDCRAARDKWRP